MLSATPDVARIGKVGRCLVVAIGCVVSPQSAHAQAIFEQFNFEVSFSPPGALPKGMGRAFTAAVNDPSGAETNPGSLAQQGVGNQYMIEFAAPKYLTARATDFATGGQSVSGDRTFIPSHFALVRAKSGRPWIFTGFASTFLSFSESFSLPRRRIPDTSVDFFPTDGKSHLTGRTFGLGVGWRGLGSSPRLGVGVSVRLQRLQFEVDTRRGDVFDAVLDPSRLSNLEGIHGADWQVGVVAGAAWLVPGVGRRFRIGASYAYNPKFNFEETQTYSNGDSVQGFPRRISLSLPDRVALGISFVPFLIKDNESTFVAEIDRTSHSELASPTSTLLPNIPGFPPTDFSVRNTIDFHFGARLRLPSFDLLLGARTVKGHSFDYKGEQVTTTGRGLALAFDFIPDKTRFGYSAGLSRVFGRAGQLEGALSFELVPERASEVSISLVLRP